MNLDARAGAELKEAGQQLALDFAGVEWQERVVYAFAAWAAVQRFKGLRTCTIEQFRAAHPEFKPESHKAWGALPRVLLKACLIHENLGADGEPQYRRAAAPKTHAHPVRVWGLR